MRAISLGSLWLAVGLGAGCGNELTVVPIDAGANAWWSYMGLVYGTKLNAGSHNVRLEARNSGTTGDCGVNGDNAAYGRVRMLVRNL